MILSIDPGLTGALAVLSGDGGLHDVRDMPVVNKNVDSTNLWIWLRLYQATDSVRITQAVIERVSSMPGQGVASVFKFGKGYGQVLGVLSAMDIPVSDPTPGQWKREMALSSDKELSRAVAIKTWPAKADLFVRKKDNGRAEAALLGLWWLRKFGVNHAQVDRVHSSSGRVLKRR